MTDESAGPPLPPFPTPTNIDPAAVRAFTREYDHLRLAHDLTREVAFYVELLSRVIPGPGEAWNIAEAVLGGHLVRLLKLFRHFLGNAVDNRGEILFVTSRLMVECLINFQFLLKHKTDPEVFLSYLHQSLQHDRDLLEHIEATVNGRGGGPLLPIEVRMRRSVEKTFLNSVVDPADLPRKRIRHWAGKDLRAKAKELDLDRVYSLFFASQSRNVHGGWQDLLQHHLQVVGPGQFTPRFADSRIRPQPFYALSILTIDALFGYLGALGSTKESRAIHQRLLELRQRVAEADLLHEAFLASGQSPSVT